MIQLKVIILDLLANLGISTWDEALLLQILLIARYFFSCLTDKKGEITSFFHEAAEKTKAFLSNRGLSVPPGLHFEEDKTQVALYKIGSQIKHFHSFGQLYGQLVNPFSGNISSSSGTHIYDHLLWAHETVKANQAIGPNNKIIIPLFESVKTASEEQYSEAVRFAEDLEIIKLNPNIPYKESKSLMKIKNYCQRNSIQRETAIHVFSLAYCGHNMSWEELCSADNTIPELRFNRKIQELFSLFTTYILSKGDPTELIKILFFPPSKDESGLETSYIYTQILKHAKRKTSYIIDPSPDLVRKLVSDQYACSVILSNPDIVQIYKTYYGSCEKVLFFDLAGFSIPEEQCCTVCFSGDAEWNPAAVVDEEAQKCVEHGNKKRSILANIPDGSAVLVIMSDTAFNKGKSSLLREWSRHGLLLYGILLLPTFKTAKGQELPKKIILLLEGDSSRTEDHSVEILKMVHSSFIDGSEKTLQNVLRIIHKHVFVSYSRLLEDKHSVRTIYRLELKEQARKKPFRKRPASESVTFIEEIKRRLHCTRITGSRSRNNPVVYKLSYSHAKEEKDKQREIRPDRKDLKNYKKQVSAAKTTADKEKELDKLRMTVVSSIDSMLYEDSYQPEIAEDIRSFINECLKKDPDHKWYVPSLKALHYIFQEPLAEGRYSYNPGLCREMFSMNHPKLSNLVPDASCTQETYIDAIKEAYPDRIRKCPECDWSNNCKAAKCDKCGADISGIKATGNDKLYHDLFKQLLLILRIASDYGFPVGLSPVRNLAEEYASRNRLTPEQQAARNALALKAYTDEQELKIAKLIFQREGKLLVSDMARRIYYIIRYFLPCQPDEIRALNWGDYVRFDDVDLNSLIIYKKATDNPDRPELYADTGKKLKFRYLPVPALLVPLFEEYKRMLMALNSEACDPDKPLLQLTQKNDSNLHRITSKQTSTYDALLDRASGRKETHQEKILPGKKRNAQTDLYIKRSRLLESNWKYRVKEVGITDGESSYLRGVQASTTFDIHYCDYSNQFVLLMMALKLNRWINQLLLSVPSSELLIHGQRQQMTYCRLSDFSGNATLEITGCNYGTKVTITYDDPE